MSEPQTTDTFTDAEGRRFVAGCEVPEVVWQRVEDLAARAVLPNPGDDADMLRRAATACRNYVRQAGMPTGEGEWFNWVPAHLDQLAERLEPRP